MPRPDPETEAAFRALVPDDRRVTVRPMFGNVAAFANGNMFTGLFGADLFVRLPEEGRTELEANGGSKFEPMPGRAMKEYVVVPEGWREDATTASVWIERSLAWALELPPKEPKRRK